MTWALIGAGVLLLVGGGFAIYFLSGRASKFKRLYQEAVDQLAEERRFQAQADRHMTLILKEKEILHDVIRKMDRGELGVDELNAIRSGVLPESIQKPG